MIGKEMKPKKERVSLTLDQDLLREFRVLAEKDDRSLSQFINRILRYYYTMKEEELIKIERFNK